jgi:enediyne biosynthesis protein E4
MIVVNGHVYPQLDMAKLRASAGYRQRKLLFHNRGDGTFDDVGTQAGAVITDERVSRGLAVGDLDDDGRLDVVINDLDGGPQVLHNEVSGGNWLKVRLKGKGLNTGAIGAIVTARVGGTTQRRLVQSGSSYISQEDKRLHFGLGKAGQMDSIEVTWPDGTTAAMQNVKANQLVEIRQP